MSKNDFGGVNINATNSALAVGSDNIVTNTNQNVNLQEITQKFIDELKKLDLPVAKKQEITDTINAISEIAQKEKPNKTMLSGMFEGLKKGMELVTKSPALIEVYDKWKDFITPLFS